MMSTDVCVKKIIANMLAKHPESAAAITPHLGAMEESYKIIVDAILDEVRSATVTLDFLKGMSGAPVPGILSAAPGSPVTGKGIFEPIPGIPGTGALS